MQKISIKSARNNIGLKYVNNSIHIDANQKNFTVRTSEKNVTLARQEQKFFFKNKKNRNILIDTVTRAINIRMGGKRGLPGPKGEDGLGVPAGGLAGQVLIKQSDDDNDTVWGSISGSDKYYIQTFNFTDFVTVYHNLFKYPAVTVHDSAGDEVEGQIEHLDINTFEIRFTAPFSGKITCS